MNDVDVPQVYLLGKTYLTNNEQFYIRNDSIVQMAAGDRHSIIITESGRAYAFGENKSGTQRSILLRLVYFEKYLIRSIRFGSSECRGKNLMYQKFEVRTDKRKTYLSCLRW